MSDADVEGRRGGGGEGDVVAPLARFFLWADSPAAVWRVIQGLGALCAFLFVFDIFWHRHAYVPGEGLWGYHAIAGFVSFTAIVLGAKALRTVIRRDESYYGSAAIDAEAYPDAGLGRLPAVEGDDAADLLVVRGARVVGAGTPAGAASEGGERPAGPRRATGGGTSGGRTSGGKGSAGEARGDRASGGKGGGKSGGKGGGKRRKGKGRRKGSRS